MTDFFSNELRRRSGIDNEAATIADLRSTLDQYLNNPGHDRVSPERSSWTTWDPNTVNGGYNISYYVTGALLGEMMDLYLRNATDGVKGIDDVQRILFDRYAGPIGYTGENILNAVNEVCGCDMQPFFGRYVSGHESFDVAPYLAYAGLRLDTVRVRTDSMGRPLADTRASITSFNGVGSLGSYAGSPPRLALSVPEGSFGRAGLNDGDFIVSVNGAAIATPADFRAAFARAKVGDKYVVVYTRAGVRSQTTATILPYDRLTVGVTDLPTISARQRAVRAAWLAGYDAALWRRVRM
jgi:predicted metalloprotease with PDZ domain